MTKVKISGKGKLDASAVNLGVMFNDYIAVEHTNEYGEITSIVRTCYNHHTNNLEVYVYGNPYSDEHTNVTEISLVSLCSRKGVI